MFTWISKVGRSIGDLQNEERPGRPYQNETDGLIPSILPEA
jgi:hypothetical protein